MSCHLACNLTIWFNLNWFCFYKILPWFSFPNINYHMLFLLFSLLLLLLFNLIEIHQELGFIQMKPRSKGGRVIHILNFLFKTSFKNNENCWDISGYSSFMSIIKVKRSNACIFHMSFFGNWKQRPYQSLLEVTLTFWSH